MKSTDAGVAELHDPVLDPASDVIYARSARWSNSVLHLCNDNFLGIRSAVAAIPGRKLVVPNMRWRYSEHLTRVRDLVEIASPDAIVIHGMSNALYESLSMLLRHFAGVKFYGVWHGGPAQWVDQQEAFLFGRFLEFDRSGGFTRSHIMKTGCDELLERPAKRDLLNWVPVSEARASEQDSGLVLAPGTPSVYKNVFSNVIAASSIGGVREVVHYADLSGSPIFLRKSRLIAYKGRKAHERLLSGCDLVMNVSFMEAHSMVDLEAISAGVCSIHARNSKTATIRHEYLKATAVDDPGSLEEIFATAKRCLEIPKRERTEMCDTYAEAVNGSALNVWGEFLEV